MYLSKRNSSLNGNITNDVLQNGLQRSKVANNQNEIDLKSSSRVLRVVFIGLLLDLMAFAVILPLLPSLLDYYSKDEEVSG